MTDTIESRVIGCFMNVFPGLSPEDVSRVSQASLADWDSVLHVTLLASLAEEFGFEIDYEEAEELRSFALVLDFVKSHVAR
jgi:acyl carrier protein